MFSSARTLARRVPVVARQVIIILLYQSIILNNNLDK